MSCSAELRNRVTEMISPPLFLSSAFLRNNNNNKKGMYVSSGFAVNPRWFVPEKGRKVGSESPWWILRGHSQKFTPLFWGTDAFSQARLQRPCACPDECPLGSRLRAWNEGRRGSGFMASIVPTGCSNWLLASHTHTHVLHSHSVAPFYLIKPEVQFFSLLFFQSSPLHTCACVLHIHFDSLME